MITKAQVAVELSKLKDFQRRTVEHVFRRLYLDEPAARRFLVADEVGLGKTMVARGVIAKAIEHLQDDVRVDIVYVCSNSAIARQNLRRINVLGDEHMRFATRLTLLPLQVHSLKQNRVNFVSFTPGTTFDLKARSGTKEERALLVRMLDGHFDLRSTPLRNFFQAPCGAEGWARTLEWCNGETIDDELAANFRKALKGSPELAALTELLDRFGRRAERVPEDIAEQRAALIGALRQVLASVCIDALEPDLVILDEFQRFKDILHGESDAAVLAKQLFDYKNVKALLLSATPYRMLTLSEEADENHHRDFLETVGFLAGDQGQTVATLKNSLSAFRQELFREGPDQLERVSQRRTQIEGCLRGVMCRTERIASTHKRDAMLQESRLAAPLERADVEQAMAVDRVARVLGAGDAIEYWKSAPYLLNFMDGYELKKRLSDIRPREAESLEAVSDHAPFLLRERQFYAYTHVDPGNARLRALMKETLDAGNGRLLWLPPSVPYIAPSGPYAELGPSAATKALVFSSWNVVPKAIAVLLSYEAERRMLGDQARGANYDSMRRKHRALLTFRMEDGKPGGMPALALLYPCATLAAHIDPLQVALHLGNGTQAGLETCRTYIAKRVQPLVQKLVQTYATAQDGRVDERWYWAVPALLDAQHQASVLDAWLNDEEGFRALFASDDEEGEDDDRHREPGETSNSFAKHVDALLRVLHGKEQLGRAPDDLGRVIADFALASPAVCAARALLRVSHLSNAWDRHVMAAAARIAKGFRVLFNVPESIVLLRGEDDSKPYWRRVLEYCVGGNLQSVLDEYAHLLVESRGCITSSGEDIADEVAEGMLSALSPRTARLALDEVNLEGGRAVVRQFTLRCRYALRFGDVRDEDGSVARAETTRDAFNSPFRPFVLASTSVGQEGLDFHSYCHTVYHWNLPSNAVDLEQREGRVNRYKGHAVRRNIGIKYGLDALSNRWDGKGDPWARLFELAAADRPKGASELMPYWIFETEGGVSVERRVPLLPMSREVAHLERLKRQLGLYRLAFGQPRQEDLLAYLSRRDLPEGAIDAWTVRLDPV